MIEKQRAVGSLFICCSQFHKIEKQICYERPIFDRVSTLPDQNPIQYRISETGPPIGKSHLVQSNIPKD